VTAPADAPLEAPLDALLARHGFRVEDALVRAGLRGIAIATGDHGRSLVSVVGPSVHPAALTERAGWDLRLQSVATTETDGGERTLIVEALRSGVPMVRPAGGSLGPLGPAGMPAFARDLAQRFAAAHASGSIVGRLVPELVFVDPRSLVLVGCAQRTLRADAAAAPMDGAGRLFGAAYLTPSAIQNQPPTPEDDVFLLAALLWRWRHGIDPFEGPLLERMTLTVEGGPVARGADEANPDNPLDLALLRAFDPRPDRRPSAAELVTALEA
jgi:hypothetical protein